MPIFALDKSMIFPPVHLAEPDGLLAIGGDLSLQRLLAAYHSGIFPWYEGDHILWWSPDPRFVLFPSELIVSKSMKQVIRRNTFSFTTNKAFPDVIARCKKVDRKEQAGTWISDEMQSAYTELFNAGYAQSAETWLGNELVGGLYGVRLGNVFCGESMFSLVSNASKFAFILFVQQLQKEGVRIIDCQVHTEHLESLGARMIPRKEFIRILDQNFVDK